MRYHSSQTVFHAFLYGGASALLALDLFFLIRAIFSHNFVPIMPIIAGVFIAGGLLLIIYAENQARNQEKKEFRRLARVAHQLERPLHTLQEDLASLVKQADNLPPEGRLKLKRMDTKAKTLLENIRDTFLMMRAHQGSIASNVRTYNLCNVVREAVEQARPLSSAKNVTIVQKAHCHDAPVSIDRQLMLIALVHIIENGIIYTLTPGMVNIAVIKGKASARVIVQDRGIGIQPEDAGSIFLPFARGEKAEQYDPNGIGVGLTLARLIIQEMGGTLRWRIRNKSMGTEFEIQLPLANV